MQSITVSLPVRNLNVSKAFFAELGLTFSPDFPDPDSACMVIGENVRVLLVAQDRFRDCVNGDASRPGAAAEVLICLPARSEREVDEIVMRAIVAGGRPWPVLDERPVHSGSFQDPDGHLWQVACPRELASIGGLSFRHDAEVFTESAEIVEQGAHHAAIAVDQK